MFLGGRYIAADALAMGLVNKVLPDDALEKYTAEILQTLSDNAPLAIANSKTIIEQYVQSQGAPDAAAMQAAMKRCIDSEDYKEGRRAFMEKRKPRFQGK
jgi:enoyl-CoA hydratase/carnithine racemase